MSSRVVKLTVVTDFACVNCCIGQHELLEAIAYSQDTLHLPLSFELEHFPFRLINDTSSRTTHPRQPFPSGARKRVSHLLARRYEPDDPRTPPRAKGVQGRGQKLQVPLLCAVFKAHMEDEKDIADINVLAELAESHRFLESDELEKEVNTLCDDARSRGITGVPMTIIDGKWAVSGVQSADVFIQIFKKLAHAGVHNAPLRSRARSRILCSSFRVLFMPLPDIPWLGRSRRPFVLLRPR
ncbi:thioredoxin-like protein [Pholiota molesta]|nr:thioredoxin-like protein [Pholiota molesta]